MTVLFLVLLVSQFVAIAHAERQHRCDNSICNHEGVCQLVAGLARCDCIGSTYFRGQFCSEPVDNCSPNPCKNGAACTNGVGQYVCGPCPAGMAGQRCSVRASGTLFTRFHLLFNHIAYVGEEQRFLVTVETIGDMPFSYEITADTALIEAMQTAPPAVMSGPSGHWVKSSDLVKVANDLGLHNAIAMPYRSGYYFLSTASFWQEVTENVLLIVYHEKILYTTADYALYVQARNSDACQPEIVFRHCANPKKPLFLDVARYNNFEPLVLSRCGALLTFEWFVTDQTEKVVLHQFGFTKTTLLKVKPYLLAFAYSGSIMQSYMIQLQIREKTARKRLLSIARCFVFVQTKPVQAVILGGDKRNVQASQAFELDGSASRDFALAPNKDQKMKCSWQCSSADDTANDYCQPGRFSTFKGHTLTVPAGALKLGKTYSFSLKVTSIINIFSSHETTQAVTLVTSQPLFVVIACVRNCVNNQYAPERLVHLQALCLGCGPAALITHSWTVNGAGAGEGTNRLLYTPTAADATISVELTITWTGSGRQGTTSSTYSKNSPPEGAGCIIDPASGIEFETEFYIECQDYHDTNAPISYQFMAGDFTLDRTNENATHLRLPQLASVKVVVCDFLFACTETQVPVAVAAMTVPSTEVGMRQYLARYNSSLQGMLENGDIERAMVLVKALTKRSASLEILTFVLEEMRDYELWTMQEIEQFAEINHELVAAQKPLDYKKAGLIARYIAKLTNGFMNVVADGEIYDILTARYEALSHVVADMLAEFSVELEKLPELQIILPEHVTAENRITETYPDIGDFDTTVLERVNNWLQAVKELHKFLHYMGLAATMKQHEPTERPLEVMSSHGLKMEVFNIEGTKAQNFSMTNQKTTVYLSPASLAELQSQLKSPYVLLQLVSLQSNPFWWYPDEQNLSTEVVYFSAYSRTSTLGRSPKMASQIEFETHLLPPSTGVQSLAPAMGFLHGSQDMPIFIAYVPQNTLLIARFVMASANLRILFQLNKIPRCYQVRKSSQFVPAQSTSKTFIVANDKKSLATAYLAVLAAEAMDSQETFQFILELRECLSWRFDFESPQWSTAGCRPALDSENADRLRCSCFHLSAFAGKVHAIPAEALVRERRLLEYIPISWQFTFFLTLLFIGLLLLLRKALCHQRKAKEHLVVDVSDQDINVPYDTLVSINTGHELTALTTANVVFTFNTWSGRQKFVIYQQLEEPLLLQNSTCTMRLPLKYDNIVLPMTITICQDNVGRYPSWHCTSIDVIDLTSGRYTHILVNKWILNDSVDISAGHIVEVGQLKTNLFVCKLEQYFLNWFQFQALAGPWQSYHHHRQLNQYERSCIWISKFATTFCIVICYFRRTTLETYEEERERYYTIEFRPAVVLALSFFAFVIGLIVELGFRSKIFK